MGGVVGGREGLGECEGWCTSRNFPTPGATATLRRFTCSAGATLNAGIAYRDTTFTPADFGGTTDISFGTNLAYDEEDDGVIFVVIVDGAYKLVKYTVADGVVWTRDWSSLYEVPRAARVIDGELTFWRAGSLNPTMRKIDARTGEIIYELDDWGAGGELTWGDPLTGQMLNMTFSGIFQAFPDRIARDGVPLSAVVTSLCARVGLEAGDIDVAQLTDQVRGFSLARQVSIRGGLELLAVAYNFDCVESDGQLKFKKRGSSSIRVITQDELAYVSDPDSQAPELFLETRAQDVDLPARFTVRYNDIERDSDIGVQTVKRIVRPAATMQSQNEATLDLPLVLSAGEAKEIALRQGFAPWIERVHHQWRVPWTHIDIDPGDVVTVALDDGRSFEVRVLKVDIGANLELAWETVVQESSSYDVSALTSGGLTYRRAIAAPTPATRLLIADSPLLADGDDAAAPELRAVLGDGRHRPAGLDRRRGVREPRRRGVRDHRREHRGGRLGLLPERARRDRHAVPDRPHQHAHRQHDRRRRPPGDGERARDAERRQSRAADRSRRHRRGDRVRQRHRQRLRLLRSSTPCCAACAAPRASSATTSSGRCSCCSRRTRSTASCCPWTSWTRSATTARSAAAAS